MEKLLITGSTGFIGRQLLGVVENPRCVVRADEKHSLSNCFTVTNIDENTDWTGAFDGIEAIIHLAGVAHVNGEKDEAIFQSVNTKGTLALARQAASSGVRRFVFVSSIGVNGTRTVGVPFSPYEPPNPHNAYSTSKFDAEVGLKKSKQKLAWKWWLSALHWFMGLMRQVTSILWSNWSRNYQYYLSGLLIIGVILLQYRTWWIFLSHVSLTQMLVVILS